MRQLQIIAAITGIVLMTTGCFQAIEPEEATVESSSVTLTIFDVWGRAMESGNSAAYMTIQNSSDSDITITDVRADFARMAQIHQTIIEDDVARMEEVEGGLTIPAGESVSLEPGGYHVMLMDLQEPLVEDEAVSITLTANNDRTYDVVVPIRTEAPQD